MENLEPKVVEQVNVDEQDDKQITNEDLDQKSKQTREQDSFYAKLRRENEELKKQKESLEKTLNSTRGLADTEIMKELGIESLENEDDLFLYKTYQSAIANGNDEPIAYANREYRKMVRDREKSIREQADLESREKETARKDAEDLHKKFGVTRSDIKNDPVFMGLYGEEIKVGNVTKLYSKYKEFVKPNENSKKKGVLPTNNLSAGVNKEQDPLDTLNGEEFHKLFIQRYKR